MKIPFKKTTTINNQNELTERENEWMNAVNEEEKLTIDVYETAVNLIVKSTIAGVKSEDINISLNDDVLTIKGSRRKEEHKNIKRHLYQECFWGSFSRTIILPMEVKANQINATLEDGILTITLPISKPKMEKIIKVNNV